MDRREFAMLLPALLAGSALVTESAEGQRGNMMWRERWWRAMLESVARGINTSLRIRVINR